MPEKQKILVVDDGKDIRDLLGHCLKSEGYEVDLAGDGQEGLGKFPDSYFALFTDLEMPGLDGVGLIKGARERGYIGAAFLMSATPDSVDKYLAVHGLTKEQFYSPVYCNGFLKKPFSTITAPLEMLREYRPQ